MSSPMQNKTTPDNDWLEYLLNKFEIMENGLPAIYDLRTTKERFRAAINAKITELLVAARNNSLLDLEQWAKLHNLDAAMILDGIEHMVISNLQVPEQPRLNHADRIAALKLQASQPINVEEE